MSSSDEAGGVKDAAKLSMSSMNFVWGMPFYIIVRCLFYDG